MLHELDSMLLTFKKNERMVKQNEGMVICETELSLCAQRSGRIVQILKVLVSFDTVLGLF
jgi:hypothetical protein